jgi:hypothetical protein
MEVVKLKGGGGDHNRSGEGGRGLAILDADSDLWE